MKLGVVAAMVSLIGVGAWLVVRDGETLPLRAGVETAELRVGTQRGVLERLPADDSFRLVFPGSAPEGPLLNRAEVERAFGKPVVDELFEQAPNFVFELFNITSWASFAWVVLGLLGQVAFFLRMLAQWIASERRRESVVPELFWWLSLFGGIALFSYFVWRKDLVGVLGQTTGVVVYARNLRLIQKQRRRLAAGEPAGAASSAG